MSNALAVIFALASLADLVTTYVGISLGVAEGNPLMRWALLSGGFLAMAVFKLAGVGFVVYLSTRPRRYRWGVLVVPVIATVAVVVLNVEAIV